MCIRQGKWNEKIKYHYKEKMIMGWEEILGVEGEDLADAYEAHVAWANRYTSNVNPKDYCVGIWRGKQVRFKKTCRNHMFTEEECAKLLADEVIRFPTTRNDGTPYIEKGKLENLEYKGHKYVGFKSERF